jgi:hypothetical protein
MHQANDELTSQEAEAVASESMIEWERGQSALRDEVTRVTTLLRSIRDPSSHAVGQWNLSEVAMHLSQVWLVVPSLARRDLSRVHEMVPSLVGAAGDSLIRDMWDLPDTMTLAVKSDPERDPAILATALRSGRRSTSANVWELIPMHRGRGWFKALPSRSRP